MYVIHWRKIMLCSISPFSWNYVIRSVILLQNYRVRFFSKVGFQMISASKAYKVITIFIIKWYLQGSPGETHLWRTLSPYSGCHLYGIIWYNAKYYSKCILLTKKNNYSFSFHMSKLCSRNNIFQWHIPMNSWNPWILEFHGLRIICNT